MPGLNKFNEKERRLQRRRNFVAKDLASPKYHQRVIDRKRIENEDGSVYYQDRYYDEEDD